MPFLPEEQRKASFKHIYGKQQVDPDFDADNESLEAGHQVFSADLLSAGNDIAFSPGGGGANDPVTFTSSSVWTIGSGTGMSNVWSAGNFQKTANSGGTDSNYEKVTMPLIQFDTGHETHATFIHPSQSSNGQQAQSTFLRYRDGRLKNWLSPTKFGAGYTLKVFGSNADRTGPDTAGDQLSEAGNTFSGKNYGAMAFDYAQGVLYFAKTDSGDPDLSSYNKPLWLVGYRYIGPTGSAAGGGGGITAIDSSTDTNLAYNQATSTLTLGNDTADLSLTGDAAPYLRQTFQHDFARSSDVDFSSIMFTASLTCSSDGFPLTATASNGKCNNYLFIPTIHMPMGKGYAIAFTNNSITRDVEDVAYTAFPQTSYPSHLNFNDQTFFYYTSPDLVSKISGSHPDNYLEFEHEDPETGNTLPIRFLTSREDQVTSSSNSIRAFYKSWFRGGPVDASSANALNYDPAGQNSHQIIEGLKDLINASCSNHVFASVKTMESAGGSANSKYLRIEQVYAGNPYGGTCAFITGSTFTSSNSIIPNLLGEDITSGSNSVHTQTGLGTYATRSLASNGQYIGNAGIVTGMHKSNEWYGIQGNCNNMWDWEGGRSKGLTGDPFYPRNQLQTLPSILTFPGPGNKDSQLTWLGDSHVEFHPRLTQLYPIHADLTGSNFPGANTETLSNGLVGQKNISKQSILKYYRILFENYIHNNHRENIFLGNIDTLEQLKLQQNTSNGFWDFIYNQTSNPFIQMIKTVAESNNAYFWGHKNITALGADGAGRPNTGFNRSAYTQSLDDDGVWTGLYQRMYSGSTNRTNIDWIVTTRLDQNYINPTQFSNLSELTQVLSSSINYIGDWNQSSGFFTVDSLVAKETAHFARIVTTGVSSSGAISASAFYVNGQEFTGSGGSGAGFPFTGSAGIHGPLSVTGNTTLGNSFSDHHEITGSVEVTGSFKANKGKFGSGTVLLEWDEPGQISGSGNFRAGGNAVIKNALSSGPAILGISGSEKAAYNAGKLDDFFKATGEDHYSLYVRNGLTIVGSHIVPDRPHAFDLGSKRFPFRDLHLDKSSIVFHSGSSEESGSDKPELGRLSINTSSLSAEFTSGSELIKVRAKELTVGGTIGTSVGSVQLGTQTQGFIAVNANESGQRATILRAESEVLSGDQIMGSITQKGSGSFAILLDADAAKSDAKFVIESNNPVPGVGSRLFHVSESGEVRSHGYLTVSQSLEVGTHITASGDVSASGTIIGSNLSGTNTGDQDLSSYSTIVQLNTSSSTLQTNINAKAPIANPLFTGNITASGNVFISGSLTADNLTLTGSGALIGGSSTKIELNNDDYWKITANGVEGLRIMNSGVVVNEGGISLADFRVESNTNTHLLFTDSGADKVAIGTDTVGSSLLTVNGDITATAFTGSLTAMTGIVDGGTF